MTVVCVQLSAIFYCGDIARFGWKAINKRRKFKIWKNCAAFDDCKSLYYYFTQCLEIQGPTHITVNPTLNGNLEILFHQHPLYTWDEHVPECHGTLRDFECTQKMQCGPMNFNG